MSYLVLFARKMSLKSQINDKNYQLMQKQQELQDLQSYTAAIADGEVSMNDLTTTPASMFGNMSQYMVNSHNYAMSAAQQNYAYLQASGQTTSTSTDATAQTQYQQLVMKNLYDQQKSQYLKAEQAKLQVKDKQLDNECLKLEQELKQLEAEYESIGQSMDSAIKDSTPQYVA
jgi:uncharacterized protein (DUF3084 family)